MRIKLSSAPEIQLASPLFLCSPAAGGRIVATKPYAATRWRIPGSPSQGFPLFRLLPRRSWLGLVARRRPCPIRLRFWVLRHGACRYFGAPWQHSGLPPVEFVEPGEIEVSEEAREADLTRSSTARFADP